MFTQLCITHLFNKTQVVLTKYLLGGVTLELETKEQLIEALEGIIARIDALETAGTEAPADEPTEDVVEETTDAETEEDLDEIAKLLALQKGEYMQPQEPTTRSFTHANMGDNKLDKSVELNSSMSIADGAQDEYTRKIFNLGGQ